ncbi:MAG: DEAD/DEAH box helicase [Betaproteobacteria bacterium]|nr:DEAD/DEAH box helicase [Betaproteobacteria bacterium]NBY32574.1 DEAD/DEAH box helicase [Betaproteobacteria bacterium]
MNFDELNLAPAILKAVREQGYDTPTPIQAQAIPAVLAGQDLLAGAQTGTGKTAAFTLPMLHKLTMSRSATNRFGVFGIRALVLTPTRELAAQVEESVRNYGKHLQLQSAVIFGGVGMAAQIKALKKGVDILVATPGRLLDLQQQGFLDLSTVQMLVLDEADRMLDMGFIHDVKKVLALVPKEKQSLLFSATFSQEIRDLAAQLLHNPQSIQVTPENTTVQLIKQVIHPVGRQQKKALLAHIIETKQWSQVLVFCRTKFGANHVADFLNKQGITAMALHGNKSQTARTQALSGFKSGEIRVLVATDIAARGIDIDDLPHVVNYEIPNISEDYVHRIGRTGRAGASGEAVSLVSLDEEGFMQEIEKFTRQTIEVEKVEGYGPGPDERAEPIAMGRQTLWGGLGKPPSRDVMAAAARAARQEMMERIREKKPAGGGRGGEGRGDGGLRANAGPRPEPRGDRPPRSPNPGQPSHGAGPSHNGAPRSQGPRRDRPERGPRPAPAGMPRDDFEHQPPSHHQEDDFQPRANAHLGTQSGVNAFGHKSGGGAGRQPDPTMTSVDLLSRNNRGGGGGGGKRRTGGGGGGGRPGGGGGGYAGKKSGGGFGR